MSAPLPAGFGTPLWAATVPAPPPRPPLSTARTTDVAVVGGGFLGLSAALHLAEAGRSVTLVEAGRIGDGASGRNAGFVVPNFARADPDAVIARLGPQAGERLLAAVGASADLVFDLVARHAIACAADRRGWIQAAHAPAAVPRLVARANAWADRGRPVEWLDAAAVARATGLAGHPGGWIDRSGGVVDPLAYARGLAVAAERAGAAIAEESPVRAARRAGAGWLLEAGSGTLRAGTVVVATNAFAALDRRLRRSLLPLTVHQIATAPLPPALRARILPGAAGFSDSARDLFTVRLDAAGRLITGGMAALPFGAERRLPRAIHRRLADRLGLADPPPIAHAWTGVAAVMPDFLPHVFELAPGLLAAIGCNGRGVAVTTLLGKAIADRLAGGADIGLDAGAPIPVPFHALARHAPRAFLPYGRIRDALERRSGQAGRATAGT